VVFAKANVTREPVVFGDELSADYNDYEIGNWRRGLCLKSSVSFTPGFSPVVGAAEMPETVSTVSMSVCR
jgi:hypothetical protein